MKQDHYRQCKFKSGNASVVAWVEEAGIEVGARVAFEQDSATWWDVVSVGTHRITKEAAKNLERRNVQFQTSLK